MASKHEKDGAAPPEAEALMNDRSSRPVQKSKLQSFCDFLYDRRAGTVLGRTGKSWLEITVFYIIFYACLAGFWAICLAVFIQTLDPKVPRYYGKGTIIGVNPGMGYQPWLRKDPESTLVHFNISNPESYAKYVQQIEDYLSKYANTDNTRVCDGKDSNRDEVEDACRFDLSAFEKEGCGKTDSYGFKNGQPCLIITLNRLIGWEPVAYPKDSAPSILKDRYDYNSGNIALDCEGEYYADSENMGPLKYIPTSGLEKKYYPYKVMKNYHQPIAMVKFTKPTIGVLVEVECKAYAYNIIHDRADRQGMVHFEILVDS